MITSVFARVLHREVQLQQLDTGALFEGTGLNEDMIWGAASLESERFLHLLRNGRELLGAEGIGFRIGGAMALPAMSMMGIAMSSAPTLRDGLQSMSSYSSLQADYVRFQLVAGPKDARVVFDIDGVGDCLEMHVEATLIILRDYIRAIVGRPMAAAQFWVSYPRPACASHYETELGGAVRFAAEANAVVIPAGWLDTRSPSSNASLWTLSQEQLALELQAASGREGCPFSDHLRSYLQAQRPPLPDIKAAARSLHLSVRTLNRRLHAEGQTFRQLRLDATHAWACRLLQQGDSVASVALAVGYEDPANFRRSFRSRMGLTPTEWRDSQLVRISPAGT